MRNPLSLSFLLLSVAVGCGDTGGGGTGGTGGSDAGTGGTGGSGGSGGIALGNCHSSVPDLLSEWGLFENIRDQVPEDDVLPYELISPLFTDYALKHRFVTLTDGGQIEYFSDSTRWLSPPGTIYVKTFAYPPNTATDPPQTKEQLVETRLVVHYEAEDHRLACNGEESCWDVHVYVYTEDQTEAICEAGGVNKSITFTNPDEEQVTIEDYRVPSNGQCRECHRPPGKTRTLGPSTGQLNRGNNYQDNEVENQIDALYAAGWLAPEPTGPRTTYVDPLVHIEECETKDPATPECYHEAARSWLDANCSHCHAPDGALDDSGVFLDYANLDPTADLTLEDFASWGICKTVASGTCGGLSTDIIPGDPDNSVLPCRVESTDPSEMMAPLGRSVTPEEIVPILRQWIRDLPILFPELPELFPDCNIVVPK